MAKRSPAVPRLGEVELGVLEHLWEAGESDVTSAHAAIGAKRGISPNTVGSALERLFKKGLVRRSKVSYAYMYRPALTREEFAARKLLDAAGNQRQLARTGVLAAFVNLVANTDEKALAELECLVRAWRKEKE